MTQKPVSHQLFYLVLYALLGMAILTVCSILMVWAMRLMAPDVYADMDMNSLLIQNINVFKITQGLSSVLIFAFPVWAIYRQEGSLRQIIGLQKPRALLLAITILILMCSAILIQGASILNMEMKLPASFSLIENKMKEMEYEAKVMTERLLKTMNLGVYFINILIVAVLPAICEELFFRAGLQNILRRWFRNAHLAIWVAAFIFSAIHFQFYGFLPRMLLGVIFGYLYVYSKNIVYNIFAHFLNNAIAVSVYFYLQVQHLPLSKADENLNVPWYGYLICAIITLTLFVKFKKIATS